MPAGFSVPLGNRYYDWRYRSEPEPHLGGRRVDHARGKRAESVADEAVDALALYLCSDGAVDPWIADQLLLPLAMANAPSELRTNKVTRHLLTNAEVVQLFLPVKIGVDNLLGGPATVQVRPGPADSNGLTGGREDPCSAVS